MQKSLKCNLLEQLLEFEKEYKPYGYNEERLVRYYNAHPHLLISLLLSQARELLDECRAMSADIADLEEELLLCKEAPAEDYGDEY